MRRSLPSPGIRDEPTRTLAIAAAVALGNVVTIGPVEYRSTMFRQLNPRIAPDDAVVGSAPPDGSGYYAAFLVECNRTDRPAATTPALQLENAFSKTYRRFEPCEAGAPSYRSVPLGPDECLPEGGATAERVPGRRGGVRRPVRRRDGRPFVLELRGSAADADVRRVELDL